MWIKENTIEEGEYMRFKNLFRKEKMEKEESVNLCNVIPKSSDCSSVNKIRLLNEEISKIKFTDLPEVIEKYTEGISSCHYYISSSEWSLFIYEVKNKLKNDETFESYFSKFGSELDEMFSNDNRRYELQKQVSAEKEKLGI